MEFQETHVGTEGAQTLTWVGDRLIDWVGARAYQSDGEAALAELNVPCDGFDSVLAVPDGRGSILYERLGTKAILLYDGRVVREWSRSHYQADRFDYPICTTQLNDGRQVIIHCPEEYSRLEIEELFTGTRLTTRTTESPDFFHSRLQVSPDRKWLLSAGWFWHPIDSLRVFSLDEVLREPEALDREPATEIRNQDLEVQSAVFTPDSHILIVTALEDYHEELEAEDTFFGMRAGQVGLFSPSKRAMSWIKDWTNPPGRVEVGGPWALCLYEHPRLFRWSDWSLLHEWPHLPSGKQTSSIATRGSAHPAMCFDLSNNRFAVSASDGVTVVEIRS